MQQHSRTNISCQRIENHDARQDEVSNLQKGDARGTNTSSKTPKQCDRKTVAHTHTGARAAPQGGKGTHTSFQPRKRAPPLRGQHVDHVRRRPRATAVGPVDPQVVLRVLAARRRRPQRHGAHSRAGLGRRILQHRTHVRQNDSQSVRRGRQSSRLAPQAATHPPPPTRRRRAAAAPPPTPPVPKPQRATRHPTVRPRRRRAPRRPASRHAARPRAPRRPGSRRGGSVSLKARQARQSPAAPTRAKPQRDIDRRCHSGHH